MVRSLLQRFYHACLRSTLVWVRARERRTAARICAQPFFDEAFYLSRYPEVSDSGLDAVSHYCRWGDAAAYWPHPLFDPIHYSSQFPELPIAGGRRLLHFLTQSSEAAHRSPHQLFDAEFYRAQYGGTLLPGENPLLHYLKVYPVSSFRTFGRPKRRDTSWGFGPRGESRYEQRTKAIH